MYQTAYRVTKRHTRATVFHLPRSGKWGGVRIVTPQRQNETPEPPTENPEEPQSANSSQHAAIQGSRKRFNNNVKTERLGNSGSFAHTTRAQHKQWKQPSVWTMIWLRPTEGTRLPSSQHLTPQAGSKDMTFWRHGNKTRDFPFHLLVNFTFYFQERLTEMDFLVSLSQLFTRRSSRCSPNLQLEPALPGATSITVIKTQTKRSIVCGN